MIAACARTDTASRAAVAADTAHPWRKPGDKVDSLLSMTEYLARFRAGLTEPARLTGGETSRDGLARRYLEAVSRRDTVALLGMLVSRAEYAWLVYPDHLYSRAPYELDPSVAWLQLGDENGKGLSRVLQRYGGRPLEFRQLACARDTLQVVTGPDTLWGGCRLTYRTGDSTLTRTLFGSIVQRDGRMKFLSYHSEF